MFFTYKSSNAPYNRAGKWLYDEAGGRVGDIPRALSRFLNPGVTYSEVQLERKSGRLCCTPGRSVQQSSSGVHSSINAQWVTWFEEVPEAICMLNVQSFPLSTISPVPVVSEGEPTGGSVRELKDI